jgi:hypothetical protein
MVRVRGALLVIVPLVPVTLNVTVVVVVCVLHADNAKIENDTSSTLKPTRLLFRRLSASSTHRKETTKVLEDRGVLIDNSKQRRETNNNELQRGSLRYYPCTLMKSLTQPFLVQLRKHARLSLIVLVCLVSSSCSSPQRSDRSIGFYGFRISAMQGQILSPVGDQEHAWVIFGGPPKIGITDAVGKIVSSMVIQGVIWPPPFPLTGFFGPIARYSFEGWRQPWILTVTGTVATVRWDATASRFETVPVDKILEGVITISTAASGETAWVLYKGGAEIALLRRSGDRYHVERAIKTPEIIKWIVASRDGAYVWAVGVKGTSLYGANVTTNLLLLSGKSNTDLSLPHSIGRITPIEPTGCILVGSYNESGRYASGKTIPCLTGALDWGGLNPSEISGIQYQSASQWIWVWLKKADSDLLGFEIAGGVLRPPRHVPINGNVDQVFFDTAERDGQDVFVVWHDVSGNFFIQKTGQSSASALGREISDTSFAQIPGGARLYVESLIGSPRIRRKLRLLVFATPEMTLLNSTSWGSRPDMFAFGTRLPILAHPDGQHLLVESPDEDSSSDGYIITTSDLKPVAPFGSDGKKSGVPSPYRDGFLDGSTYWTSEAAVTPVTSDSGNLSFNSIGTLSWGKEKEVPVLRLPPDGRIDSATVRLDSIPSPGTAYFRIELQDLATKEVLKSADQATTDGPTIQLNWRPKPSVPYACRLVYRIPGVYYGETKWDGVVFALPLSDRPDIRTVVLYILLVLFAMLLSQITLIRTSIRRWLPPAIAAVAGSGSVSTLFTERLNVDGKLLVALIGCTFLLALVFGLLSTKVFRYVSSVEPFHFLAPLALASDNMRERLYRDYIKQLLQRIELQRKKLGGEFYTNLPCELIAALGDIPTTVNPVTLVLETSQTLRVLISGPGGRGKSAILRQLAFVACTRYQQNPSSPIPIFSSASAGTVVEIISKSLGEYAFSNDILNAQLTAGHFIVFIDGLTEGSLEIGKLSDFLKTEPGKDVSVVCSGRQSDSLNDLFMELGFVIVPRMLDDSTLEHFQNTYLDGDRKNGLKSEILSEARMKVCRSPEGTYLPILVRLCMQLTADVNTLSEIYDRTFGRLLGTDLGSAMKNIEMAADLCVRTYWKTGSRSLVYARATKEDFDLLTALLKANILIPNDPMAAKKAVYFPEELRFFHDSMQSYLTARGLLKTGQEWGAIFREACVARRFRNLSEYGNPEIFQMCIEVFGPRDLVARILKEELSTLIPLADRNLSKETLLAIMPRSLKTQALGLAVENGVGEMLKIAIFSSEQGNKPRADLGALFAGLAAKLYAEEGSVKTTSERGN